MSAGQRKRGDQVATDGARQHGEFRRIEADEVTRQVKSVEQCGQVLAGLREQEVWGIQVDVFLYLYAPNTPGCPENVAQTFTRARD